MDTTLSDEEDDDWGDFDSNCDEDDYGPSMIDDDNIITSQIEKQSSSQYVIYTQNEIKSKINDIVEQVSSYLDLPNWTATLV